MIATLIRRAVPERVRPIGYLTHLARTRSRRAVMAGPFSGMRYIDRAIGSAYIPKLLGTYEKELERCVEEICRSKPSHVIDIGCAEGYYAVGFARRLPCVNVIAFEMDSDGQAALRSMAELNGVADRLEVGGECSPTDMMDLADRYPGAAYVIDVEGHEDALLSAENARNLAHATVLVELHEFIVPGITQALLERFRGSHEIELIWQEPRHRSEFPWRTWYTGVLPSSYIDWAVDEWRPIRMSWLWMKPRARLPGASPTRAG